MTIRRRRLARTGPLLRRNGVPTVQTIENTKNYRGQDILAIMAGWKASHRSLEVEAAEIGDMQERDSAARVIFQRRGAK